MLVVPTVVWLRYTLNFVTAVLLTSQSPRGLRRGSAAARSLGFRVRIPPGAWMSVSCECCVLSGREVSATDRSLVQRSPTECGVSEYDRVASKIWRPWPTRVVESWKKKVVLIMMRKRSSRAANTVKWKQIDLGRREYMRFNWPVFLWEVKRGNTKMQNNVGQATLVGYSLWLCVTSRIRKFTNYEGWLISKVSNCIK